MIQAPSRLAAVLLIAAFAAAPGSAFADDGRRYTIVALTYEAAAARFRADSSSAHDLSASTLNHHVPRLELVTFGIDWFLKLEAGDLGLFSGQARYAPDYIAGGEVGVHWATIPFGILAVGLKAGGTRIGIGDGSGSGGGWIAGGTGFDAGVVVHYAFPLFGVAHVDPSISAGGSYLAGQGDGYAGAWTRARLEVLLRVLSWASVQVSAGLDLRTYSARTADPQNRVSFDGRIFTAGAGIAVHL
jgi:hypothetical protein